MRNTSVTLRFPVLFLEDTPRSIFEPRVCCDGGFAAVSIVIQQLLTLVNVSRSNEDEVRNTVDVVEFGLAVSIFTVIYQPTHSISLFCGIHTVETKKQHNVHIRLYTRKTYKGQGIKVSSLHEQKL